MSASAGTSIRSAGAFILLIASKKPPGVITAIRWTSSEVMSHAWDFPRGRNMHSPAVTWKTSPRGFLAGVVRKKLGLNLVSEQTDKGRVYHIKDGKATSTVD